MNRRVQAVCSFCFVLMRMHRPATHLLTTSHAKPELGGQWGGETDYPYQGMHAFIVCFVGKLRPRVSKMKAAALALTSSDECLAGNRRGTCEPGTSLWCFLDMPPVYRKRLSRVVSPPPNLVPRVSAVQCAILTRCASDNAVLRTPHVSVYLTGFPCRAPMRSFRAIRLLRQRKGPRTFHPYVV